MGGAHAGYLRWRDDAAGGGPRVGRRARAHRRMGVVLGAVAVLGTAASAQGAPRAPLEGRAPTMAHHLWREGRFEVMPHVAFTVGDVYEHHVLTGVGFHYNVLDWLAVGLSAEYGISLDTDLHERIDQDLRAKRDAVCPADALDATTQQACLDALDVRESIGTRSLQVLATAEATFVPVRGKFMLFGRTLGYFDAHVLVGGTFGVLRGEGGLDRTLSFGPSVGVGFRIYVSEWVGITLQARDFLLQYSAATDQHGVPLPEEFHNHVAIRLAVDLSFPMTTRTASVER